MNRTEFIDIIFCNEPDFSYNGKQYSICHPKEKYYVTAEDSPSDSELAFDSPEDLLDNWIIQGKCLGDLLQEIDLR